MKEIFHICDTIISFAFFIYLFVLFYMSIKKCFVKGSKKQFKLFLMTLIMNPFVCFVSSIMFVRLAYELLPGIMIRNFRLIGSAVITVLYFMLVLLFAWVMAKWIDIRLKSPILFLFLMYNTIFINQLRGFEVKEFFNLPGSGYILNILGFLITYFIVWIFYEHCVKSLSVLSLNGTMIEWRVFIIPPSAFIIISLFLVLGFGEDENMVIVSAFFMLIECLFVWAFYVIIKNIKATNDMEKSRNEVKALSVEVMEALAHTIDAKDEYTRGHSVRVAKYSRMIAERLNLTSEECENVYYMALLHDIGKIGVPNEIINSTSKLTDDEYAVIKTHPNVGFDILNEIKSRPDLSTGARWHHERFDGKGYPDRKKGDDIPFFARIIAVADSYDAMTSNRSYRKYLPQAKVRSEIENNIGTQFDPNVAKCMLAIIDEDVDFKLHE